MIGSSRQRAATEKQQFQKGGICVKAGIIEHHVRYWLSCTSTWIYHQTWSLHNKQNSSFLWFLCFSSPMRFLMLLHFFYKSNPKIICRFEWTVSRIIAVGPIKMCTPSTTVLVLIWWIFPGMSKPFQYESFFAFRTAFFHSPQEIFWRNQRNVKPKIPLFHSPKPTHYPWQKFKSTRQFVWRGMCELWDTGTVPSQEFVN